MASRERERGAAAVEFALLLPVLLTLLLGTIEFGYAFSVQAAVSGAARVGVRDYTIHYQSGGSQTTAINVAKAAAPDYAGTFVGASFTNACSAGSQTTLNLSYQYQSLTGWFDPFVGNVTLTGKGSMQCGG